MPTKNRQADDQKPADASNANTTTNTNTNTPDFEAFVVENPEGAEKGYWTKIGAAWSHDDGHGLNLTLTCIPLTGKIVLRTPKREESPAPARNPRRV